MFILLIKLAHIKGVQVLGAESWGRYNNKTKLGRFLAFAFNQFFRLAGFLHGKISVQLSIFIYSFLYGVKVPNPEDTWVRLTARKET